jgi:hypothetical protein
MVLAFVWLVTRQPGNNQSYKANFQASLPGALGCLAAAIVTAYIGWQQFSEGTLWLDTLCGILGLLSTAGLLLAGYCRLTGKKPYFVCYMLPCVFFALYVFFLGREMGGEPEIVRYLFRYLAVLSLVPACYQLWGFCVSSGERKHCLFWCLLAGYLCIVSAPSGANAPLYLLLGAWMLTNPCSIKYLPRRKTVAVPLEPEVPSEPPISQPEIPLTMEEMPLPPVEETDIVPVADAPSIPQEELEWDVDEIIAEILREIDSNVQ